jgi:hypothetical protein
MAGLATNVSGPLPPKMVDAPPWAEMVSAPAPAIIVARAAVDVPSMVTWVAALPVMTMVAALA